VTDAASLGARFIVDATGSTARFARQFGARSIAADNLQAFVRFFDDAPPGDPRTVVEAFEHGWWYTAGLPNGGRIAACMTDADLGRELQLTDADSWTAALDAMPVLGALFRGARAEGPVIVRPAESRRLDPVAGDTWLATGDAASTFDPLSSQGILKALRSGTFASYAIGDLLTRGDATGIRRYQRFIEQEFATYTATRAKYYAEEGRWRGSVFWGRRGEGVMA
jgi:flavin-dependent dehydrogenase